MVLVKLRKHDTDCLICDPHGGIFELQVQLMSSISMTASHIASLLQNKEGEHIEFKRSAPSSFKLAKGIAAMANTTGGTILIGVADDGVPVGVAEPDEEKRIVLTAAHEHCSPPIEPQIKTVSVAGKTVLWVIVEQSRAKHTVTDPRGKALFYVRVKDKNLPVSGKAAQRLQDGPGITLSPKDLDRHETALLTYLKKHQKITLQEFSRHANISKRRASQILVRLEKAALIRSHDFDKRVFYTLNPGMVK